MDTKKIVSIAMTSFFAITTLSISLNSNDAAAAKKTNQDASDKMEKCYGIAKAGLNECQTATASCAGSSTKDKQGDAFIFVQKGLCSRIVDGSLKPR